MLISDKIAKALRYKIDKNREIPCIHCSDNRIIKM